MKKAFAEGNLDGVELIKELFARGQEEQNDLDRNLYLIRISLDSILKQDLWNLEKKYLREHYRNMQTQTS